MTRVKHLHAGKVRDLYEDRGELLLVASDRVSVYDVPLPTPIPDKGKLLTQLSVWWFERFRDLVPNHLISATDVPAEFAGRAVRCRPLDMIKVECVARGYLTGSGLAEYRRSSSVCGVPLPPGLVEGSKLPEPIFTPTTKADSGHDLPITFDDVVAQEGRETAEQLRELTLRIYREGARYAAERGIIVADTKLEFGWDADGRLTLADEVLTSDSSRFWPADEWEPGRPQYSFDKQYVRDWATSTGWDKTPPGPALPPEVVEATRRRYIEVYERLTGRTWNA
ncbi:phosphoribosylaminoimidazolesuccinocarboxamide synthase [Saccharomonospora glauca]|jgi:phosphoribosylaminoimidazole-succinocarboxamide synthase|uniref:Phosphoribosylaminoimidazole-succinocarboxamide synthase n=1 Tax=Saccharomonospora glauca K62 TaxID=928724 RepID=I1CYS3_9PSEU|nr:phosphoribosylaminoimidazolesuccinocarboxamide synthase [Saccharomonospora glauca]EIE97847.1 phosphoribosylaminoimidazole-succinocarboxamide synthase [Saccharomonospora glauca K62]